jgi:hypothetical protein
MSRLLVHGGNRFEARRITSRATLGLRCTARTAPAGVNLGNGLGLPGRRECRQRRQCARPRQALTAPHAKHWGYPRKCPRPATTMAEGARRPVTVTQVRSGVRRGQIRSPSEPYPYSNAVAARRWRLGWQRRRDKANLDSTTEGGFSPACLSVERIPLVHTGIDSS